MTKSQIEDSNSELNKIEIFNRTENDYLADTTIIEDKNVLKEFVNLYDTKHSTGNYNIKNNFGFFEIVAYHDNKMSFKIAVYYTVYDGVVVVEKNAHFKNDEFIPFLIKYSKKVSPSK